MPVRTERRRPLPVVPIPPIEPRQVQLVDHIQHMPDQIVLGQPLPHIDRLVEATAGHQLLSFMDAFSGYNQILMNPEDQEKTSFITD